MTDNIERKVEGWLPEGEKGTAKIERFEIDKNNVIFGMFSYKARAPMPGTYTRLMVNKSLMMSDTNAEYRDHISAIMKLRHGRGLIAGLGLGLVADVSLQLGAEHLTIIEINQDVIDLVGPHLKKRHDDKVEIINADIFTWKAPKGVVYDAAWFDVWKDICADNYESIKKLHRRFGSKARWKGSWAREIIQRELRSSRNHWL